MTDTFRYRGHSNLIFMKTNKDKRKIPTYVENKLVKKCLAGDSGIFKMLLRQFDSLSVVSREIENNRYLVEFELCKFEGHLLENAEANIEIEGTLLKIEESREPLYVRLVIMDGQVKYLEMAGKFDFRNNFTLKQIFWENKTDGSLRNTALIYDPMLRNCDEAISYIPKYK